MSEKEMEMVLKRMRKVEKGLYHDFRFDDLDDL